MRALVTGGAGFIGSHLVDLLLARGWQVIVLDNLITGSIDNIQPHLDTKRIEFMQQDATEYISIEGDLEYVFHFASPASPVDFDRFPIQVLKVGALGTHKSLGVAKQKGASFMLASTSEVYGDPAVSPQPETYWGNVNPIGPRGVYDEAKRYAEAMTMAYHRVHGVKTHIVRLFNTYGPRMRLDDGRVVPNLLSQAIQGEPLTVYGDGLQTRSFGYVGDIVEGIYALSQCDDVGPVNLGSDHEMTILEFAQMIRDVIGKTCEIQHLPALQDDPRQRRPDLTLARQLIQWNPTTTLAEGLQITYDSLLPRIGF